MGFGIPVHEWLQDELKEYLLYYLDNVRLKKEGIFDVNAVISLRDHYLANKRIGVIKLWYILIFQIWKEKWLMD
jgi:asparagine synthase (glutamine-hydrolysing)